MITTGGRFIIVGSGVAGAMVAKRILAQDTSATVLMLEAGAHIAMRDRRVWQDLVTAGVDPYYAHGDSDKDAGIISPGVTMKDARLFGRGGTTAHWYGMSLRFKPEDFRLHSNTNRELDWPYGYETLEPYYLEAEHALGIAGDSNADDPPRHGKRYPLGAPPFTAADGPVIAAMEALGMSYGHLPIARSSRCVTTGTCIYCPVGGKYSADMTLDELELNRRFELRINASVLKLVLRGKRSAAGIEYLDLQTGSKRREDADSIVICGGAFETPKLLLTSASRAWKNGMSNDTGHVGRHPKVHDILLASGTLSSNPQMYRHELDFATLCTRHFDTPREQRDGKFYFSNTNLEEYPALLPQLMQRGVGPAALDMMGKGPVTFNFYGHRENFSEDSDYLKLASGSNRLGLPKMELHLIASKAAKKSALQSLAKMSAVLRQMGTVNIKSDIIVPVGLYHFAGTTRMSTSAADGVVDQHLAIHDMDNVHICSNAVFPNISAVNPTLTLAALALKLGDHLTGS